MGEISQYLAYRMCNIGRGCGLKFIDMPTHNKTSDCMVKTCNCMYTDNNPVVFNHEVEVFVH